MTFTTTGVFFCYISDDEARRFGDLPVYELADHYDTPKPFNFEAFFNATEGKHPRPNIRILSEGFNLLNRLPVFYRQINMLGKYYKPKNVMILIGDDFSFSNYSKEMTTWDAIVRGLNSNAKSFFKGSTFRMATAGEYFQELDKENPKISTIPVDDYFPLIDEHFNLNPISWTGYFSTRPHLKRSMKRFGQLTRSIGDMLGSMVLSGHLNMSSLRGYSSSMFWPKWLVGVNTHHDAITGTCEREVCQDYLDRIDVGIKNLSIALNQYLLKPLLNSEGLLYPDLVILGGKLQLPEKLSETTLQKLIFFGTHSGNSLKQIRIITGESSSALLSHGGKYRYPDASLCDRIIGCEHIYLTNVEGRSIGHATVELKPNRSHDFSSELMVPGQRLQVDIQKAALKLSISDGVLAIEEIPSPSEEIIRGVQVTFSWLTYTFSKEWCSLSKHAAGSYAFSTCNSKAVPIRITSVLLSRSESSIALTVTFTDSKLAAHVVYDPRLANRFSVRSNFEAFHTAAKEVDFVLRVSSNIESNRKFKTDSNGLVDMQRTFGHPRYGDSAEYNYYPVTTHISVQDSKARMTLFVDRATGGSSLGSGSAEIMLQRVNKELDKLGLTSKLIEPYPVSIVTEVLIDGVETSPKKASRSRQLQVELESSLVYVKMKSIPNSISRISANFGSLLPPAVRSVVDIIEDSSIFLRFTNFGEPRTVLALSKLIPASSLTSRRQIDGSASKSIDSIDDDVDMIQYAMIAVSVDSVTK